MKKSAAWIFLAGLVLVAPCSRATQEKEASEEKVPLDVVETETSYVLESDLNHGNVSIKQDELQNDFSYAHRFFITGNFYARAGVSYNRFDFGRTAPPVPLHLQSLAGIVSLDYMHGADIGAMLELRPGFYTESDFRAEAFDCPITLMRFFVLQPDKLYVMAGVNYSFLRRTLDGVLPIAGLVWVPNEKWRVMAVLREPRLIYSVSKQLDLYVGGEVEGGSFRTDQHKNYRNNFFLNRFNEAELDYLDLRGGAGLTWSVTDQINLDLGAGYAIQRKFDFNRIDEVFRSDPAPFVRFEIKAKF